MKLTQATGILADLQMNFDDGWTPLTASEMTAIWPVIQDCLGTRAGDLTKIKIAEQPLSFIPGARFFRLRQRRGMGQTTRYMIQLANGVSLAVHYSPRIIDELREQQALQVTDAVLGDYIAFYWRFTAHGRPARIIDHDQNLATQQTSKGILATGDWHEHGQSMPLEAIIAADGHITFTADDMSLDAPPRHLQ
ncbi:MAG: hypothetical protein AAF213_11945 [Pseudomonadota bacterium]